MSAELMIRVRWAWEYVEAHLAKQSPRTYLAGFFSSPAEAMAVYNEDPRINPLLCDLERAASEMGVTVIALLDELIQGEYPFVRAAPGCPRLLLWRARKQDKYGPSRRLYFPIEEGNDPAPMGRRIERLIAVYGAGNIVEWSEDKPEWNHLDLYSEELAAVAKAYAKTRLSAYGGEWKVERKHSGMMHIHFVTHIKLLPKRRRPKIITDPLGEARYLCKPADAAACRPDTNLWKLGQTDPEYSPERLAVKKDEANERYLAAKEAASGNLPRLRESVPIPSTAIPVATGYDSDQ